MEGREMNEEQNVQNEQQTQTLEKSEEKKSEKTTETKEKKEGQIRLDYENDPDTARKIVESVIYVEGNVGINKVCKMLSLEKDVLREIVNEINSRYEKIDSGMEIRELGDSFHMIPAASIFAELSMLYGKKRKAKISKPQLQTLAVIAYKQPITKAELDEIRGRDSSRHIKQLMKEGLIKYGKRKDILHRPQTLITTDRFLLHFDLRSLEDLPTLREIKDLNFSRND